MLPGRNVFLSGVKPHVEWKQKLNCQTSENLPWAETVDSEIQDMPQSQTAVVPRLHVEEKKDNMKKKQEAQRPAPYSSSEVTKLLKEISSLRL